MVTQRVSLEFFLKLFTNDLVVLSRDQELVIPFSGFSWPTPQLIIGLALAKPDLASSLDFLVDSLRTQLFLGLQLSRQHFFDLFFFLGRFSNHQPVFQLIWLALNFLRDQNKSVTHSFDGKKSGALGWFEWNGIETSKLKWFWLSLTEMILVVIEFPSLVVE